MLNRVFKFYFFAPRISIFLGIFFLFIFQFGCITAPDFSEIPNIKDVAISKIQLPQESIVGFNGDFTIISFTVEDGDGDLGFDNTNSDIFLIDARTGFREAFQSPVLPDLGTGNGVSAKYEIKFFTTCCQFPDNIPPCTLSEDYPTDTLKYSVQIIDRAGNQSNILNVPEIILKCI